METSRTSQYPLLEKLADTSVEALTKDTIAENLAQKAARVEQLTAEVNDLDTALLEKTHSEYHALEEHLAQLHAELVGQTSGKKERYLEWRSDLGTNAERREIDTQFTVAFTADYLRIETTTRTYGYWYEYYDSTPIRQVHTSTPLGITYLARDKRFPRRQKAGTTITEHILGPRSAELERWRPYTGIGASIFGVVGGMGVAAASHETLMGAAIGAGAGLLLSEAYHAYRRHVIKKSRYDGYGEGELSKYPEHMLQLIQAAQGKVDDTITFVHKKAQRELEDHLYRQQESQYDKKIQQLESRKERVGNLVS